LCLLFKSAGLSSIPFESAEDFLAFDTGENPGCLVLDIHLRGLSGLDLHKQLAQSGNRMPVILISGDISVANTVQAIKDGADNVFEKPFNDEELLMAVTSATRHANERFTRRKHAVAKLSRLSDREQQVVSLLMDDMKTSQIARALSISPSTVEKHRLRAFEKLEVSSVIGAMRVFQMAN